MNLPWISIRPRRADRTPTGRRRASKLSGTMYGVSVPCIWRMETAPAIAAAHMPSDPTSKPSSPSALPPAGQTSSVASGSPGVGAGGSKQSRLGMPSGCRYPESTSNVAMTDMARNEYSTTFRKLRTRAISDSSTWLAACSTLTASSLNSLPRTLLLLRRCSDNTFRRGSSSPKCCTPCASTTGPRQRTSWSGANCRSISSASWMFESTRSFEDAPLRVGRRSSAAFRAASRMAWALRANFLSGGASRPASTLSSCA